MQAFIAEDKASYFSLGWALRVLFNSFGSASFFLDLHIKNWVGYKKDGEERKEGGRKREREYISKKNGGGDIERKFCGVL